MNDIVTYDVTEYDPARYDGLTLGDIIAQMRGSTLSLLKKATWKSLIARRDLGGLLVAASKLVDHASGADPTVPPSSGLGLHRRSPAHEAVGLLAADRQDAARSAGILPQARRPVRRAGLRTMPAHGRDRRQDGSSDPVLTPPPPVFREPLPADVAALTERVEMLELQNRLEREKTVRLTVELDEVKEELDELKIEKPPPKPDDGWLAAGWPDGLAEAATHHPPDQA